MGIVLSPLGDVQHIGPVLPLLSEKPHLYPIKLTKEAIRSQTKMSVYDFLEVTCVVSGFVGWLFGSTFVDNCNSYVLYDSFYSLFINGLYCTTLRNNP